MKTVVSKCGVLLAITLLATAAVAASAQAVTWNPDNIAVSGTAQDPTLEYSDVTVTCAEGTLDGVTGMDSDTLDDVAVDFFEPCDVSGHNASVDCGDGTSTVDLIARTNDPPGGTGDVRLNEDFECVVAVGVACTITLQGPQTASGFVLDEANDLLYVGAVFAASRSGSSACGANPTDNAGFSAVYDTSPSDLTIDP